MTCHLCRTLGGLRISFRGQAIPCDCHAGDKWREANRQEAATDAMLGLVPADHSIVELTRKGEVTASDVEPAGR